jgi:hypothetical protein
VNWPWTARLKARRQLAALLQWARGPRLFALHTAAAGYYAAGDWLGVESCYMNAREGLEIPGELWELPSLVSSHEPPRWRRLTRAR